jgi:hypothetical protein
MYKIEPRKYEADSQKYKTDEPPRPKGRGIVTAIYVVDTPQATGNVPKQIQKYPLLLIRQKNLSLIIPDCILSGQICFLHARNLWRWFKKGQE